MTDIPARNRAVKALLIKTYGKDCGISVTAGRGTAYHWIEIRFATTPQVLQESYARATDIIEGLIRAAGIKVHTYCSDGDYEGTCIDLHIQRKPRP